MCWDDVTLNKTADGVEFLEYNERQTKTRTGANVSDVRPFAPKMFATKGSEKDPVTVYKLSAQKRPYSMKGAKKSVLFGSKQFEGRKHLVVQRQQGRYKQARRADEGNGREGWSIKF